MSYNRSPSPLNHLIFQLETFLGQFGYQTVDLPVIEPADLFLIKAGDQVVTKLFTFERYGQQYALRPEFTAAAAYHYNSLFGGIDEVVRWQFSGPIFIDDPGNSSQTQQRFSAGAELIGMAGAAADAEIMGIAAGGLQNLLRQRVRIVIGHTGLVRRVLHRFHLDSRTQRYLLQHLTALSDAQHGKIHLLEQFERLLSQAGVQEGEVGNNSPGIIDTAFQVQSGNTMGGRTQQDIMRRLSQKRKRMVEREQVLAAINELNTWVQVSDSLQNAFAHMRTLLSPDDTVSQVILNEWRQTVEMLQAYGIQENQIVIQPALARSWEYYTGMVFELQNDNGILLGGGGRYDELARLLGSQTDVPAVGFAYYFDQILSGQDENADNRTKQIIIAFNAANAVPAVRWAQLLRQAGFAVQLLPDNTPLPHQTPLHITEDGKVRYIQQVFAWEAIDDLTAQLRAL